MDADLSHQPEELPRLLHAVTGHAGLVIGSRYVPGGCAVGWSAARRLLSRAGGGYARLLLRLPVHDATSGFRAYRTSVLCSIDRDSIRSKGYGFQIEMTHRVLESGATVDEVPITFHERAAGRSKMSAGIALEALVMVTRLAFRPHPPHRARALVHH
jgi:dolichol-phosphate mannosyltransferase